jgi:hypothetical protein
MKNILHLTIAIFMVCAMNQSGNAQIVYTDINPDVASNSSYSLDLNNDGVMDFNISAISMNLSDGYSSYVNAYGLNGNRVATSLNSSYAKGFSSGTTIDGSAIWSAQGTLKSKYNYCVPFGGCSSGGSGSFGGPEKFLGLQLVLNGQSYYGWARLKKVSVSNNSALFTIKDYAFDSTPNHSIFAGATSGARLATENSLNENSLRMDVFPNPSFNSTIISFSLPLSENISLKIFDMSGKLISTLADKIFEEGDNEVVWNAREVNAGIYFLQLQSPENLQTKKLIVTK